MAAVVQKRVIQGRVTMHLWVATQVSFKKSVSVHLANMYAQQYALIYWIHSSLQCMDNV